MKRLCGLGYMNSSLEPLAADHIYKHNWPVTVKDNIGHDTLGGQSEQVPWTALQE